MTILYEKVQPTGAGTHILVVGVGRYPHLIDGTPGLLAENPLGLGQLSSPLVSVKSFIDWCLAPLFDPAAVGFENPDRPLLSLEGLVSSEAPVVVTTPVGPIELGPATRSDIKDAFTRWLSRVTSNDANIGVLFFCGHGVMVTNHYLLAEDFGQSADDPWDGAIDISLTLRAAMRLVKGSLYFFIDACKQFSRDMFSIQGSIPKALTTFDIREPVVVNAVSLIEATGEGKLAFALEKGRASRFSEALLMALSGYCGVRHSGSMTWDVDGGTLASTIRRLLEEGNKTTKSHQFCQQAIEGASVPLLRLHLKPRLAEEVPLTIPEIRVGLQRLDQLLLERAPVTKGIFDEITLAMEKNMGTDQDSLSVTARHQYEQALTRLNNLCECVVEISFYSLVKGGIPPQYDSRPPFIGLLPFKKANQDFFFGRERLVEKLLQKFDVDNFLPLLGPSGSGKSSLVLAGILPGLTIRDPDLQVVTLMPGSMPMEQLETLEKDLGSGPVLYIVDQFEEVFTLCKEEKQRTDFIDAILNRSNRNRVVLTMRADFWGECAPYDLLKERMQARQELIAPMTADELRRAIELQAAKVGLRFEVELSNTIVDEVAGEPGAMPLLQYALLMLWERRYGRWLRADEYRMLGGVKGAISATADKLYDELSALDQARLRDIFLRLTRLDEDAHLTEEQRDTRRRLSLADLVPEGVGPEAIRDLVTRLTDARLLVTSVNSVTNRVEVEVCHEALIRHWSKLRSWLDDDRTLLRVRDDIGQAAREWEKDRNDDSRLVHRGVRLQAAEELLTERQLSLTPLEVEYIAACIADRHKLEVLKASRVLGKAYELVLHATELSDPIDTPRSLSLAVESYQAYPTVTAYRTMWNRRTYPKPSAVIDIGASYLGQSAVSADGRYVASVDEDCIHCWSTRSGGEATLVPMVETVLHLAFAPTSRWFVALTDRNLLWVSPLTGDVRVAPLDEKCYPILQEETRQGLVAFVQRMQRELPKFVVTAENLVILQTVRGIIAWRLSLDGGSRPTLVLCKAGASQFCTCPKGDHLVVVEKDHLTWYAPEKPPMRRDVAVGEVGGLSCEGTLMFTSQNGNLNVLDLESSTMVFQGESSHIEGTCAVLSHVRLRRFIIISPKGFEIVCCKTGSRNTVPCEIGAPHDSPSSSDDESHVLVRAETNKVVVANLSDGTITTITTDSNFGMSRLSPSGKRIGLVNRSGVDVYLTKGGKKLCHFAIRSEGERESILTKDLRFDESETSIFHLAEVGSNLRFDCRTVSDLLHFDDEAGYVMGLRGPMVGIPQRAYRVTWADLSTNGSAVAMLVSQRPIGGTLVVRNPELGTHATFAGPRPMSAANWISSREIVCSFEDDNVVYLLNVEDRSLNELVELRAKSTIYRIATKTASHVLVTVSVDQARNIIIHIFSLITQKILFSSKIGKLNGGRTQNLMDIVCDVCLSTLGRYLATCTATGNFLLFDVDSGDLIHRNDHAWVRGICFSNDDKWCVFVNDLGVVSFLETTTLQITQSFVVEKVPLDEIHAFLSSKDRAVVGVSDDKSVLMTAFPNDSCIRYWSINDARQIGQIRHVENRSNIVCVSEDGQTIAVLKSSVTISGTLTISVFKSSWPSDVVTMAKSASSRPLVVVGTPPDYSSSDTTDLFG